MAFVQNENIISFNMGAVDGWKSRIGVLRKQVVWREFRSPIVCWIFFVFGGKKAFQMGLKLTN